MLSWKELEPHVVKNVKLYNASRPEALRFMTRKQMSDYDAKVEASEGFDVDECRRFMPGGIVPIGKDSRQWMTAQKVAEYAAYDTEKKLKLPPWKSITLIKATYQVAAGLMYYVTFHGIDSQSIMATYRAKVWLKPGPDLETCYSAKVPNSEIQVTSSFGNGLSSFSSGSSSSKPTVSAFFAYVRELRKQYPLMTFAQARRKGSRTWKCHLTVTEKNRYRRAAKEANAERANHRGGRRRSLRRS